MRALLDVNGLIALLDEEHVHHDKILAFLTAPENLADGFATCGITQLGAIRVMSGKGYYKPVETEEVAGQLQGLTRKGHRYLGIPAPTEGAIRWKATRSNQATDATLLSTAVAHGCRLVTFDAGIPLTSVAGAKKEHLVVLGN
jgi:predicted nucleic acid-binding protein